MQALTAAAEECLFIKAVTVQIVLKDADLSSEHVLYSMLETKFGEVLEQKFQLKQAGLHARFAARVTISEIQGHVLEATGTISTSLYIVHGSATFLL